MVTIRRLAHSCLLVTSDTGTTLFDPGFFSWDEQPVDLDSIGDVQRVCITHEHADHVKPEFVAWLRDRGTDVAVHGPASVADVLAPHDIAVSTAVPADMGAEDVDHGTLPNGSTVPNRSWTVGDVLTHPGDSYAPTASAPVLALPLMTPWGSATEAVAFARRVGARQVVPVHDLYLTRMGRGFIAGIVRGALAPHDIEVVELDWGESVSV